MTVASSLVGTQGVGITPLLLPTPATIPTLALASEELGLPIRQMVLFISNSSNILATPLLLLITPPHQAVTPKGHLQRQRQVMATIWDSMSEQTLTFSVGNYLYLHQLPISAVILLSLIQNNEYCYVLLFAYVGHPLNDRIKLE